jgi:hypothetical protein
MIPPIRDDTFGPLEWDPLIECWLGGIAWPDGLVTEVALWPPGGDPAADLQLARDGLAWVMANEEEARRLVAGAMLEFVDELDGDDAGPITADAIAGRMELVRIGAEGDGSLLLTYDAPRLRLGHVIDGEFAPDRSFLRVGLVG